MKIRNWIENLDTDSDSEEDLGQLDGDIKTPDSLTPDVSPEKVCLFQQKRAVRIISNFYMKVIEMRTDDAWQDALDQQIFGTDNVVCETFEDINLNDTEVS